MEQLSATYIGRSSGRLGTDKAGPSENAQASSNVPDNPAVDPITQGEPKRRPITHLPALSVP